MAMWTGTHAEIVRLHCNDDTTRQLYLLLLQRLVQLPAEGVVGHDVWTSLAEFCENLVNVSRQWGDHATPAMTVGVWRRVRGRC